MSRATLFLLSALALPLAMLPAGCGEPSASSSTPPAVSDAVFATARAKDLFVQLQLPKSHYVIGEEIPVTIFVMNLSQDGLKFSSSSGAPYRIRLERATPMGWEVVKEYPLASAMVLVEWSLTQGESRTIETKLPVERDWPTYENLRLRANLPNRPNVAPAVHIEVTPKK